MSLPFTPDGDLIIVPVKIWGPTRNAIARLALDTGATATMVSWRILAMGGYTPDMAQTQRAVVMGSGVIVASRVPLDRLTALEQERRNFPVLGYTLPVEADFDGVLGLDFLRGQRLLIDFRLGLVLLD